MKKLYTLMAAGLLLAACENMGDNRSSNSSGPSTSTFGSLTESDADKAVSQRVRQALANDDSLPASVRNVTIATSNGVVTLRGNVRSDNEKTLIASKAAQVQGVRDIDNQLDVSR